MSAFLLLLICPLLGWVSARLKWMPDNAVPVINAWLLRIALPAVVLEQIPKLHFDGRMLLPALGPVVLMFSTMAVMAVLARRLNWDRGTQGAMTLCWGLGNTSFVGFPLLIALIGPQALGPAVIADQAGFYCTTLIGLPLAAYFAGQKSRPLDLLVSVLRFVPVQALFIALAMKLVGLQWNEALEGVLKRLSDTLSPLALFSVGLQLQLGAIRRHLPLIGIGVAWKLLLVPGLMWVGALVMGVHGLPITVGILQVAMAPMITAGIFAKQYGLNPEATTAMISTGIAVSFLTVPMWYLLIGV